MGSIYDCEGAECSAERLIELANANVVERITLEGNRAFIDGVEVETPSRPLDIPANAA